MNFVYLYRQSLPTSQLKERQAGKLGNGIDGQTRWFLNFVFEGDIDNIKQNSHITDLNKTHVKKYVETYGVLSMCFYAIDDTRGFPNRHKTSPRAS